MQKISSKKIHNRWVIFTLLIGLLITGVFAYQTKLNNEKRILQTVQQASEQVFSEVVNRVKLYQYGLRGARGVVLTAGEHGISKEAFRQYSLTRDLEVEFPGARGFGFVRRVPQEQVESVVQSIRQRDWPEFEIQEFSSNFVDRYLIQYFEPYEIGRFAIGLDIASEKNRREAASAALYSGEVRITSPITFIQGIGKPQQSILIMMPIYRGGAIPSTLTEREKAGFGWSYAALLMGEVLAGLDIDENKVHYELYDVTNLDDQIRFYNSKDLNDLRYENIQSAFLYGRHWESHFSVTPAFIDDLQLLNPLFVLLVGAFISVLNTILIAMVRENLARKREVINYQSRIAAVVESSADGIVSNNLEGTITSWNKGAERIFGYTKEETIGRTVLDLLVPNELKAEEQQALVTVRDKKESLSIETRRITKFGAEIPVALTLSPIIDIHNEVVGLSKSVRDISERKRTETKIRELNASLENQVKDRTSELQELNSLFNDVLKASSEISIIAADLTGTIRLFNSGAERMLGYSSEEVIGKLTPVTFHLQEEIATRREMVFKTTGIHIEHDLDVLLSIADNHDYETKEWTYVHKNGQTIPVSLVVTPMKNNANEVVGCLGMAMDITDQKNNQQALVSARDQLLIATKTARLGVWSWDLATNSLECNDIMYDIYQYPYTMKEKGITLQDWWDRVHPDERSQRKAQLSKMLEGGESYNYIFRILLPDNRIRYIKSDAYIERDIDGNAVSITGVNLDVTSEQELETWLRKAKDQADAASASKSSFLANMSHEIRTPMNAILGMLHLAKRTELTHQQDDYISKAQVSAKSLLSLINDILDFSKVDAGKLKLESVPFDVESLLYELSTVLSGSSLNNNVELVFDIDKDIPAYLVGDKLRLLQVLINLVSNAVKFTLEGSVVLEVKRIPSSNNNVARLNISVNDTGIGISKDQLESIFDAFSQAESSIARRFGGSGLGLVICRRFVELMGGELCIDSSLDKGSRFFFTVDLPIAEIPEKKDEPERVLTKMVRVLVADSNSASHIILNRMALNLGWFCRKANNMHQIVEALNEGHQQGSPFDVVLLDIKTTGFDGRNSLINMRSNFNSDLISPKIILLANASDEKTNDALDLISDYLLKPLTLSRLSETVYKALSTGEHLLSKKHKTENNSARLTGINLLLVEDNAFNQQVATELLTSEGANVTVAGGGLEGVRSVVHNETTRFDLVLMDMQMPDVDGLEATGLIRQDTRFKSLPIVAMTANVSEADRQLCFQAGMNDHIGKPLDIDQMLTCILKHVKSNEKPPRRQLDETILVSDDFSKTDDEYENIHSIISRFGGSVDLFKSVIDGFLIESKALLTTINDGVEACDKVQVCNSLHTLKGASLTVGLLHFSNQLNQIEQLLKASLNDQDTDTTLSNINTAQLGTSLHDELTLILRELDGLG